MSSHTRYSSYLSVLSHSQSIYFTYVVEYEFCLLQNSYQQKISETILITLISFKIYMMKNAIGCQQYIDIMSNKKINTILVCYTI